MNKIWKTITVLLITSFTFSAMAKAPVWKVTKNGNSVYLGGTVHVLSQSDYPLPKAFDEAYEKAEIIVLEMDGVALQKPENAQKLMMNMMYKDGRTYADDLKPETVEQLNAYLTSKGIPLANLQSFKPSMISITITMLELQALGLGGTGVDAYYQLKGANDKKSFKFLETAEEQMSYIANMGKGYEDELITYTLRDMATLGEKMAEMKAVWRAGENQKLFDVAAKEWKDEFETSYNQIIVERNNNWMDDLESYFTTKEVELVLVGALHLVGNDGVLKKLSDKGYTIEQM